MNIKMASKYVIGVISTIILGAIGSGIWERLLSPSLDRIYRAIIDLISSVSLDYKNNFYASVASSFNENYPLRAFSLLLLASIGLYIALKNNLFFHILKKSSITSDLNFRMIIQILGLSLAFYCLYKAGNHIEIYKTNNYSATSLDILRPYIGDKSFHKYKSDYLQIKTAESFYLFNEEIIKDSKVHKLILPKFDPI